MKADDGPLEASQRPTCPMQLKGREDVAKMFDMIYSEASTAACSSKIISYDAKVAFPGRYVTRVVGEHPLEVAKRFVRPRLTCDAGSELNADTVVKKIFNIRHLDNVLLVITPTTTISNNHVVHGFVIEEERHLGVTSLTTDEKNLIICSQRSDGYSVIYCSNYIDLEDAFKKSRIRNQIFDVFHHKCSKPMRSWYDGKRISISYRCHPTSNRPNTSYKTGCRRCKLRTTVSTRFDAPLPSGVDADRGQGTPNSPRPRTVWRLAAERSKLRNSQQTRKFSVKATQTTAQSMELWNNLPLVVGNEDRKTLAKQSNTQIRIDGRKPTPKTKLGAHIESRSVTSKPNSRSQPPLKTYSKSRVTFGSSHFRRRVPSRNGGHNDVKSMLMTLIHKPTHSKLKSHPNSPAPNYSQGGVERKSADLHIAAKSCRNDVNASAGNEFYPLAPRGSSFTTLSMQRGGFDSPTKNNYNATNLPLIKIQTQSVQRSLSDSPIVNRSCELNKSIVNSRTQSDLNVCSNLSTIRDQRTSGRRTSSVGSEQHRPRTWMSARSPSPNTTTPACFNDIDGPPRDLSKNRSVDAEHEIKTPLIRRSHSPVSRSSSNTVLRSLTRTQLTNNKDDLRKKAVRDSPNSLVTNKSNSQKNSIPFYFNTYSQNSVNDAWLLSDATSVDSVGDKMTQDGISKNKQTTISAATSYVSVPSTSPRNLSVTVQSNQGNVRRMLPVKPAVNVHNIPGILKSRCRIHSKLRNTLPQAQFVAKYGRMSPCTTPRPSCNGAPKTAHKRQTFISQAEKAKMLQRQRQWNYCVSLNTNRRISFENSVVNKSEPMAAPVHSPQRDQCKKKSDGIKVLWKPHPLCESVGAIYAPTKVSKLKFDDSQTIIKASSSFFDQLTDPLRVPTNFSKRATEKLHSRLNRMTAKQAFENLGKLVDRINSRVIPQNRQLVTFFRIAELLDIKLFVRSECHWPDAAPTIDPRCRVDSYMFDDRKDFILSIGMLYRQLVEFSFMFPGIKPNIRLVDNALELTKLPSLLTKCIRSVMVTLRARGLFDLLAEITYELMHPQPGVLTIPQPSEKLRSSGGHESKEDEALRKLLAWKETVRELNMKHQISDK